MHERTPSRRLAGGHVAISAEAAIRADVTLAGAYVRDVDAGVQSGPHSPATIINLDGYLLLPGLINAHDHLEFNLFPRLGSGPYSNSAEWSCDIYAPHCSPLREHLSVPKEVRLWWGGLKNLLSGVTTVCHHNPWASLFDSDFPVSVVRRYGWAHSIAFERNIPAAFAGTDREVPFVIHIGEGTDSRSREEIFTLDKIGVLSDRTVLVHGVAFDAEGHDLWQQRGAALVWCPTSNLFTLGTTLNAGRVTGFSRIALGSDSALTGSGTLLDELHAAKAAGVAADRLWQIVTEGAAEILRLREGEGRIRAGAVAHLVAIPFTGASPAEAVARMTPADVEMVVVAGCLHLASKEIATRWPSSDTDDLEEVCIEGIERSVRAPVSWLLAETLKYLPEGVHLAGRRVAA